MALQPTTPAATTHKTRDFTTSNPKETTTRAVAPITIPVARNAETCRKERNEVSKPHQTTTNAPHPPSPIIPMSQPLEEHPISNRLIEVRGPRR
jgi:hypothetical protein